MSREQIICYCGKLIVNMIDAGWRHKNGSEWCYPDEVELDEVLRCFAQPEDDLTRQTRIAK